MSEHYFKQAISSNYPLCLNGFGLFNQFCLNNNQEAKKLYQMAAENKFPLSYYNLGYLSEKENNLDEAIEFYIKASENENEPLTFDQYQLFDIQHEISKAFIICLTNLKLVVYYLSKSEFNKAEKYFYKSLSKLNRFRFKFNLNTSDENVINEKEYLTYFSYMRYFYLNSDLFNIRNQKNLSAEFIENLLTNLKFDFVEVDDLNSKSLFDYIINNENEELIDIFKLEIEFIIQKMESILYTYPYDILFSRISIEKSDESPSFSACKKNINEDFYEGFGLPIVQNL